LTIQAGELAIIGTTGAFKTTIASLLTSLYAANKGSISLLQSLVPFAMLFKRA
jgi:ABC-type transport system involved in cytochrome bd biosynthesis fused ATPase/permease subunit